MKRTAKRFAALLAALVLALCLSIPAFAAAPLVRDEMGLFDADTYSELEASAEAASDGHDCDVYFLVVDNIGDTDQRQYAKDYYLANGLGSGSEQSGILFLLAVGSRKYVTITYGGGVTAFTDYRIEQIEDEVVPMLSDGDYADAARAAEKLLETGLQQVYISLGGDGLYAADRQGHTARVACPRVQIANATGGGDAVAAALAACIAHGRTLEETAQLAIGAGALACTSSETIHPGMSWENIHYILHKEEH